MSVKVASSRDKIRSAEHHLSHKHDIKVISRPAWGVTESFHTHEIWTAVFLYSLTQYLQWTQHFRFTLDCNNHSNSFTKNQHDQIKTLSQSKLRKHWQADTFQIFITKLGNLYGIQQQLNDLQTAPDETTPSSCSPLCLSKTPPPRQPASFLFHSKQDWGRPASSHWNPKEYNQSSQH